MGYRAGLLRTFLVYVRLKSTTQVEEEPVEEEMGEAAGRSFLNGFLFERCMFLRIRLRSPLEARIRNFQEFAENCKLNPTRIPLWNISQTLKQLKENFQVCNFRSNLLSWDSRTPFFHVRASSPCSMCCTSWLSSCALVSHD